MSTTPSYFAQNRPPRFLEDRLWLLGLVFLLIPSGCRSVSGDDQPVLVKPHEKHRGVSWVAGPREVTRDQMAFLDGYHVNWIVQTPFGWQTGHNTPDLQLHTKNVFWGETDEGLQVTTALAKQNGVRTLLKPHIWLKRPEKGKWRSDIAMDNEDDWQSWFAQYRAFMLHYAKLAQTLEIEALCIGTELNGTVGFEDEWRSLILEIRSIYTGKLTYAANWYEEYERITFWDQLDWIGIQAYFPLAQEEHPGKEALLSGWQPHVERIQAVQRRFAKPVLFTEMGYRSSVNAGIEPWLWPKHRESAGEDDLLAQTRLYEAFFETFWDQPWFAGAYIWKWFPASKEWSASARKDFTPQGKPAREVLRRWYGQTRKAITP